MELFSGKSTSGKTVSTDPGLCRGLKRRNNAEWPASSDGGKSGSASRVGRKGSHQ